VDQLSAMRAFVRVAETRSFSGAARSTGTTQATISKRIAALEEMLGVKLLIRSSREQALTEAGQDYFNHCVPILDAVDEAENIARSNTNKPRGLIRVTASADFGRSILLPLLREFMQRYPDIGIDLVLSNYPLDLIAGGIDVAIRAGHFEDSSLIAKPLGSMPLCLVASPAYLEQYGRPEHPNDLVNHDCPLYSPADNPRRWHFKDKGKTISVIIDGRFQCDDGDIILDMVLSGKGVTRLPYWLVHEQLNSGTLELLLADHAMPSGDIKMIYPDRKHLPLKTRYFLDFMAEKTQSHPGFDCL